MRVKIKFKDYLSIVREPIRNQNKYTPSIRRASAAARQTTAEVREHVWGWCCLRNWVKTGTRTKEQNRYRI